MLHPRSNSATEASPAPLRSASPKQMGRPRSAGRDIASHPVSLSGHSIEDAGALREPLGHSLDKGALQQVRASSTVIQYTQALSKTNGLHRHTMTGEMFVWLVFQHFAACTTLHTQDVVHGSPVTAWDVSHGMHCRDSCDP